MAEQAGGDEGDGPHLEDDGIRGDLGDAKGLGREANGVPGGDPTDGAGGAEPGEVLRAVPEGAQDDGVQQRKRGEVAERVAKEQGGKGEAGLTHRDRPEQAAADHGQQAEEPTGGDRLVGEPTGDEGGDHRGEGAGAIGETGHVRIPGEGHREVATHRHEIHTPGEEGKEHDRGAERVGPGAGGMTHRGADSIPNPLPASSREMPR